MEKIIEINVNMKDKKFVRQAKVIGEIIKNTSKRTLTDSYSVGFIGAVGLHQALKYNGNLKNGVKGALITAGAVLAVDVTRNIIGNIDVIKNA